MNKIIPFEGLELIVTVDDVENIRHLIDPNNEGLDLICDTCEGKNFKVRVLIEATLDMSISKIHKQAILRDHEVHTISAIKVIKCGMCGCKDFVRESPKGDKYGNEESIGAGKSTS
jgi:hypothetical protein